MLEDDELALLDTILNPVEAHVNGFGEGFLESIVGNNSGCGFVRGYGGGWLWVYHFLEGGAEYGAVLGIEEESVDFGFSCWGHDILDNGGDDVDGDVVGRWRIVQSWGGARSCGFA